MNDVTWRVPANSPTAVICRTAIETTMIMTRGLEKIISDRNRGKRVQDKEEGQQNKIANVEMIAL